MDIVALKKRITQGIGKYKYAGIVLLVGVILMILPGKDIRNTQNQSEQTTEITEEKSLQDQLEEILGEIAGAGEVEVMLAVSQGERIIYQTDSTYTQSENSTDSRTQTILVTDSNRNETGLVYQKNPPVYQGAIVLAQGADNPAVKLAIAEAVSDITGLGTDRISILKMR